MEGNVIGVRATLHVIYLFFLLFNIVVSVWHLALVSQCRLNPLALCMK